MSLLTYDDYVCQNSIIDPEVQEPEPEKLPPISLLQFKYSLTKFPSSEFVRLTHTFPVLFNAIRTSNTTSDEQAAIMDAIRLSNHYISQCQSLLADRIVDIDLIPSLFFVRQNDPGLVCDIGIRLCKVLHRLLINPEYNEYYTTTTNPDEPSSVSETNSIYIEPLVKQYMLDTLPDNCLRFIDPSDLYQFFLAFQKLNQVHEVYQIQGQ